MDANAGANWKKRKRDSPKGPVQPCPDPEPAPPSHFLALPTELMQEICAYIGSPWSIGSACTTTRNAWKTVGVTVTICNGDDLDCIQRAFPDATNIVFMPITYKIRTSFTPHTPAFPRARSLTVKLGIPNWYRELAAVTERWYIPGWVDIVASIVPCDRITTFVLKAAGDWPWCDLLKRKVPPMPALARLHLFAGGVTGIYMFHESVPELHTVAHLRLRACGTIHNVLRHLTQDHTPGTPSRIETLHICVDHHIDVRALEPYLALLRASLPRLRHITVRPMGDSWLFYNGTKLAKEMKSMTTRLPFVRVEWPLGVDLPATAHPPPGTPIGRRELARACSRVKAERMPEPNTLQAFLKLIRPYDLNPFVDGTAMLRNITQVLTAINGYEEWSVAENAELIKSVLLSGPPAHAHKTRLWASRMGFAFNKLRRRVLANTEDHTVLEGILRELVRTDIHLNAFAMNAFGYYPRGANWIRDCSRRPDDGFLI